MKFIIFNIWDGWMDEWIFGSKRRFRPAGGSNGTFLPSSDLKVERRRENAREVVLCPPDVRRNVDHPVKSLIQSDSLPLQRLSRSFARQV